jgi:hypothetical protein
MVFKPITVKRDKFGMIGLANPVHPTALGGIPPPKFWLMWGKPAGQYGITEALLSSSISLFSCFLLCW